MFRLPLTYFEIGLFPTFDLGAQWFSFPLKKAQEKLRAPLFFVIDHPVVLDSIHCIPLALGELSALNTLLFAAIIL